MGAKYYRDLARQKLTGNWKTAVIVGLIAWLLGGLFATASVGAEITINERNEPHERISRKEKSPEYSRGYSG